MKTQTIGRSRLPSIMSASALLSMIIFFFMTQIAYGAGATSRPGTASESAAEKRMRAYTYFKEGEVLQEMKKYKEASKKYEKAVKIDDEYAEAWSNLGYTYRKQGQFDKAVRAYKLAIKLKPDLAEAHEYLGEAYAEMGKFEQAEKQLQILRDLGSDEADELEEFIEKMKTKS